ncbi:GNAT family N-acetyltransferase [Paenibacillus aceti]|uniref:N-acetyltransferase n=1 Tax=Paenibacillus aceti TaxID=1820010 RepID=A0ABQ1VS45_9BACL|nr:GNAT family N-acetyltransferase [Paenibacillus aceti]GGF94488.1 N-acetyltransferase [Paenibacillus aceti]
MSKVEHNAQEHQFFIQNNGDVIAEMTYSVSSETLYIIDHTYVDDNYRGQGLAEDLMSTVVDYARQHEIKLFGLCPFAKRQLDTRSEYADVKY